MKPERIQFAPQFPGPSLGIFRTFWFDTFRKARSFTEFVVEMADNHGRVASLSVDPEVNELTLLVQAPSAAALEAAQSFVEKVEGIYDSWSSVS